MTTEETQEVEGDESSVIRTLRERAERAADAEKRAAGLERELAFAKAGLDLSDGRIQKYFVKAYDGELTAEAIRAAAEADGFLAAPQQAQVQQEQAQASLQSLEQIAQASMGASTGSLTPPDAQDAELTAAVRRGELRSSEDIATWLQSRGQPVSWDGPSTWGDGSQFKPMAP